MNDTAAQTTCGTADLDRVAPDSLSSQTGIDANHSPKHLVQVLDVRCNRCHALGERTSDLARLQIAHQRLQNA